MVSRALISDNPIFLLGFVGKFRQMSPAESSPPNYRPSSNLNAFPVPEKLNQVFLGHSSLIESYPVLLEPLTPSNYRDKLHALLYLNEMAERVNLEKKWRSHVYLEKRDSLDKRGNSLVLPLPDGEARPLICEGDSVFLAETGRRAGERRMKKKN